MNRGSKLSSTPSSKFSIQSLNSISIYTHTFYEAIIRNCVARGFFLACPILNILLLKITFLTILYILTQNTITHAYSTHICINNTMQHCTNLPYNLTYSHNEWHHTTQAIKQSFLQHILPTLNFKVNPELPSNGFPHFFIKNTILHQISNQRIQARIFTSSQQLTIYMKTEATYPNPIQLPYKSLHVDFLT